MGHRHARGLQPFGKGADQVQRAADAFHLAAADRGDQHVGAQFDPVGDHLVRGTAQAVGAFDGQGAGAFALDLRAHLAQAAGKVDDLGFARGVAQDRGPLGQRRRHQRVFRGADRNEGKVDHRAAQPPARRLGMHIAVPQIQRRAHRLQRVQMQVHGPGTDRAAAGQRHDRMAIARQHRPQNQDRGAHLAHDVVIGGEIGDRMTGQRQDQPVLQAGDLGPQRFQQLRHRADVAEPRGIGQRQRLVRQERGGHQGQTGVLCPRDRDRPGQGPVAAHQNRIHPP